MGGGGGPPLDGQDRPGGGGPVGHHGSSGDIGLGGGAGNAGGVGGAGGAGSDPPGGPGVGMGMGHKHSLATGAHGTSGGPPGTASNANAMDIDDGIEIGNALVLKVFLRPPLQILMKGIASK